MSGDNTLSSRQQSSLPNRRADRPLRLLTSSQNSTFSAYPDSPVPSPSPALRRLQQDLEAARAEARSLRELLEELPAILERKFQQRLHALLTEQRQLEQDNLQLQHQLLSLLGSGGEGSEALAALPSAAGSSSRDLEGSGQDNREEGAPITAGLGLRRALRHIHR